jgi:hypothetical protein
METKPDTSFPALAARGHRPRIGKEPRVLLSSTTVDVSTKLHLGLWQIETGHNLGGVLDASVAFAKSKGFPRASHKKKAEGMRSTASSPALTA